jgi:hypothetical protein
VTSTVLSRPDVVGTGAPEESPRRSRHLHHQGYFAQALAGTPWKVGDVVRLVSRSGIGLVGLVGAWVGCSGSVVFRHQAGWTAGAILAVVIGATGGVTWVLSALGAVGRERRLVKSRITALYLSDRAPSTETAFGGFVAGEGMQRYHRPDCDVVRGKSVRPVSGVGFTPCGMCLS